MTVEQVVAAAARLRKLTDEEFDVLVRLVEDGDVNADKATLGRAADALADAADQLREDERVPVRFARPVPEDQLPAGRS